MNEPVDLNKITVALGDGWVTVARLVHDYEAQVAEIARLREELSGVYRRQTPARPHEQPSII